MLSFRSARQVFLLFQYSENTAIKETLSNNIIYCLSTFSAMKDKSILIYQISHLKAIVTCVEVALDSIVGFKN